MTGVRTALNTAVMIINQFIGSSLNTSSDLYALSEDIFLISADNSSGVNILFKIGDVKAVH